VGREVVTRADAGGATTLATKGGGFVFTTGTIGNDPETGELPEGLEAQTWNTLERLRRILDQAGTGLDRLVKVNVYLDDIASDFDAMSAEYKRYFEEHGITELPARTTVGCRLPWSRVEIDMVALAGS
jgi:2-iminobutanoate/2-iminopropanoate deaminase